MQHRASSRRKASPGNNVKLQQRASSLRKASSGRHAAASLLIAKPCSCKRDGMMVIGTNKNKNTANPTHFTSQFDCADGYYAQP